MEKPLALLFLFICVADCGTNSIGTGTFSLSSDSTVTQVSANSSASGYFIKNGDTGGCTSSAIGTCDILACTPPAPTPAFESAGTITVTGGKQSVTVAPDGSNDYFFDDSTHDLWNGGETLSVQAAGGTVPGFSATLSAPRLMTVIQPTTQGAPTVFNRSQDFHLAWTGGDGSQVQVELTSSGAARPITLISCLFPAGDASGTVPSTVLSVMPVGGGTYHVRSTSTQTADVGGWSTTMRATTEATAAGGGVFGGGADYQ